MSNIHQEGYLNQLIEIGVSHLGYEVRSYNKRDEQENTLKQKGILFFKKQARNIKGTLTPMEIWVIKRRDIDSLKQVLTPNQLILEQQEIVKI